MPRVKDQKFQRAGYAPGTKGTNHRRFFQSWAEWVEYCEEHANREWGSSCDEKGHHTAKWSGTATFEQAVKLARTGWKADPQFHAFTAKVVGKIQPTIKARWESKRDVRGSTVNVPRMLRDDPRSMRRRHRVQKIVKARPVRVLVQCNFMCDVTGDVFLQHAQVATALVQGFLRAGQACQVDVMYSISNWGADTLQYWVPVVKPGQPVDVNRIRYAIGHRAAFRRLFFAALEGEPEKLRRHFDITRHGGYGSVHRINDDDRAQADIILDTRRRATLDADAMAAHALSILEEAGVTVQKIK
jgi:hypothetical protein